MSKRLGFEAHATIALVLLLLACPARSFAAAAEETSIEVEGEGTVETTQPDVESGEPAEAGKAGDAGPAEEGAAPDKKKGSLHFEIPGSFMLGFVGLSDIMVSGVEAFDDPTRPEDERLYSNQLGQNFYATSRLRVSPLLDWKGFLILKAEFDLLTGPWVGDLTEGVTAAHESRGSYSAYALSGQRFRQLYLELHTPIGVVRVGQMTSQWGLGMLANSGTTDPTFGYYDGGDLTERILFATKPFNKTSIAPLKDLTMVIAGDLIYDDITAKLEFCKEGKKTKWCGDLAFQAIAALLWDFKGQKLGFYFVYRNQTTFDDRKLEVMVFDGFAHGEVPFPQDIKAYVEAETAYITNKLPGLHKATMAYSIQQPDGHDLEQFGMVGKIGLKWREIIDFWIELGYASGDSNNLDGALRQFTMDPGHRIGMLLFPEVLGWQSARASTLAQHPNMAGQPVPGVELLASNGGAFASFYFNPVLRVKPLKYLDGALGVVVARASADMVSAFAQKAGGAPLGYLGGSVSNRDLGVELDAALNFAYPVKGVSIGAGFHFGYLWPGRYFTDYRGHRMGDTWMVLGRLSLGW